MKNRKWLSIFIVAILLLQLIGCTKQKEDISEEPESGTEAAEAEAAAPAANYRIAFIADRDNAWNTRLVEGASEKAATLGNWEIESYDALGDADKQASMIADCKAQGFNAICLQPIDVAVVAPAMEEAADAGITVISLGEIDESLGLDEKIYQVYCDDAGISKDLLLNFAKDYDLGGSFNVAVIGGYSNTTKTERRMKGFEDAASELGWSIVTSKDCEMDQMMAADAAKSMLEEHTEIDVFVAMSDTMAIGVIDAIEEMGLSTANDGTGIYVIGEEFCAESKDYLSSWKLAYSVTCPAPWFAMEAMDVAADVSGGGKHDRKTALPYYWVTADNCDEAEF